MLICSYYSFPFFFTTTEGHLAPPQTTNTLPLTLTAGKKQEKKEETVE